MALVYLERLSDACSNSKNANIQVKLPVKLGRGPLMKCPDTKISRSHAILEWKDDKLAITSTNLKPTFIVLSGEERSISNGETCFIQSGDEIGLLKNAYWIRLRIITNCDGITSKSNTEESGTKNLTNVVEQSAKTEKRARILPKWMQNQNTSVEDTSISADKMASNVDQMEAQHKEGITNLNEVCSGKSDREIASPIPTATEDDLVEVEHVLSGEEHNSIIIPTRESCLYGDKCYRSNPNHKSTFAHPGDGDYVAQSTIPQTTADNTADDDLPECEYGLSCYRQNPRLKSEFKHSKKLQPLRQVKKNAKKRKRDVDDFDDSEDDYDYDDPFLNDDSSDDYQPTGSEESDYDDRDIDDEYSHDDSRRMIKEAHKFIKRKT